MAETAAQPGIELKLENGNVIKAATAEEALKVAAKMIEDNSKAYRETKASLDTLQTQYSTVQQQIEALKPKETPDGFDKDRYYQLLNENPIAAQNYVDSYRFGIGDPEAVPARFNEMYEKVTALDGQTLAAGFVNNHPEFPQDAEAAKALTERVKMLRGAGHPVSPDTMELAWSQLVNEGTVKPIDDDTKDDDELPPSLQGGGTQISPSELQKAENMSDRELQAFLKSKGML